MSTPYPPCIMSTPYPLYTFSSSCLSVSFSVLHCPDEILLHIASFNVIQPKSLEEVFSNVAISAVTPTEDICEIRARVMRRSTREGGRMMQLCRRLCELVKSMEFFKHHVRWLWNGSDFTANEWLAPRCSPTRKIFNVWTMELVMWKLDFKDSFAFSNMCREACYARELWIEPHLMPLTSKEDFFEVWNAYNTPNYQSRGYNVCESIGDGVEYVLSNGQPEHHLRFAVSQCRYDIFNVLLRKTNTITTLDVTVPDTDWSRTPGIAEPRRWPCLKTLKLRFAEQRTHRFNNNILAYLKLDFFDALDHVILEGINRPILHAQSFIESKAEQLRILGLFEEYVWDSESSFRIRVSSSNLHTFAVPLHQATNCIKNPLPALRTLVLKAHRIPSRFIWSEDELVTRACVVLNVLKWLNRSEFTDRLDSIVFQNVDLVGLWRTTSDVDSTGSDMERAVSEIGNTPLEEIGSDDGRRRTEDGLNEIRTEITKELELLEEKGYGVGTSMVDFGSELNRVPR